MDWRNKISHVDLIHEVRSSIQILPYVKLFWIKDNHFKK